MRVRATNVKSTVDIWIRHLPLCLDLCHDDFHGFAIHFYKKGHGARFPHFSQSMQYNLHLETVFTKRNRVCKLCIVQWFWTSEEISFSFFWKKTITAITDLSVCFCVEKIFRSRMVLQSYNTSILVLTCFFTPKTKTLKWFRNISWIWIVIEHFTVSFNI